MSLDDPAQGIFCFSDNIAFNVVKKMKGIPDANRAKLIGYDNIQSDIPLPITLTTIGVDKEHHANFAVKQIIEKISDPQIKLAKHFSPSSLRSKSSALCPCFSSSSLNPL